MLPSLLSLVLIIKGYQFISKYVGDYVNRAIIWVVAHAQLWIFGGDISDRIADLNELWLVWRLHIGGFVIAIIMIYFVGIFLASFVGRWIWRLAEAFLSRTPVVGQIYPHIKQVTDFFLSDQRLQYSQVVALEYPRKGIWSMGLLTGHAPSDLRKVLDDDELISVFIPSSPTPLTGYVVCTKRSEVVELSISIDDAFKFIISGGVLKPGRFLNGKMVVSSNLSVVSPSGNEGPSSVSEQPDPESQA